MKRLLLVVLILSASACDAAYTLLAGERVKPAAMCKGWTTEISTGSAYWHVPCDNVTYADTVVWP